MAIGGITVNDKNINFVGGGAVTENGLAFGGGYVVNGDASFHAGAGGVATYEDAFGNTVTLGTFTAFGGGGTNGENYGYYANINRIIFRYKWM